MAFSPGLTAAMRARCASMTSTQDTSRRAIKPASSSAPCFQSCFMLPAEE
jgi:hypothetical protein